MSQIEVNPATWRLVEVGRVVLFNQGENAGRLAAIVEIIDHKRILVEGPAENPKFAVSRQSAPLAHVSLTPLVLETLPRAAGHTPLVKRWKEEQVEKKWAETAWAKKREQKARRANLTDFERFKVMKLRKQVGYCDGALAGAILSTNEPKTNSHQARDEIRKAAAAVRKAAA